MRVPQKILSRLHSVSLDQQKENLGEVAGACLYHDIVCEAGVFIGGGCVNASLSLRPPCAQHGRNMKNVPQRRESTKWKYVTGQAGKESVRVRD